LLEQEEHHFKDEEHQEHLAEGEGHEEHPPQERPKRTYEFPSEPPFTAFVGNLAYSIEQPQDFNDAMTKLAQDRLGLKITVTQAKVMMDRRGEKPKHRGFGYIQVETLDQLKGLMELNEVGATLAGRTIQVDTANQDNNRSSRRQSDVDGSKFRGGRFNSSRRPSKNQNGTAESSAPAQRPSLKLQPRSKAADGDSSASGSASNIFGSGRARDEQAYERRVSGKGGPEGGDAQQRRRSSKGTQAHNNDRNQGQAHRRSSAGRGEGGRGGRGRGERNKSGRGATRHDGKNGEGGTKQAAPTPTPPQAEPEKPKTQKVTNAFAALAFDSDSE